MTKHRFSNSAKVREDVLSYLLSLCHDSMPAAIWNLPIPTASKFKLAAEIKSAIREAL